MSGRDENEDLLRELVLKVQGGDTNCFGELIEKTQNRLFKFCFFLSGNRVVAEDLAQEAYLKAFDRIKGLTKAESFQDWLFRIAKNLYIDQVRSGASRETAVEEAQLESLGVEANLTEILSVQKALSQFEPEDRALLILVEVEGRTYKEAAAHLETTEDAVRSRLFRVRQEFVRKWQGG